MEVIAARHVKCKRDTQRCTGVLCVLLLHHATHMAGDEDLQRSGISKEPHLQGKQQRQQPCGRDSGQCSAP